MVQYLVVSLVDSMVAQMAEQLVALWVDWRVDL